MAHSEKGLVFFSIVVLARSEKDENRFRSLSTEVVRSLL